MKITQIELYHVNLPLKEPFIVSYMRYDMMPSIIIKIHTDEGIIGYGESVPDENVTGESVQSDIVTLKHYLIPTVIGSDPRNIYQVHEKMNRKIFGNPAAKAAIDIACYDIIGKYSQLPIYLLLGGKKDTAPSLPFVLSILEPGVLAKQAKAAVDDGYTEIKMKLGAGDEKDIQRVKAVRKAVGNDVLIRVDANQGWKSVQRAKRIIEYLSPYNPSWVEQPIAADDVSLFKELKQSTSIPLMADESLVTVKDLRILAEHQSVDYINIKLMKSGGIYPSLQLATQADFMGIQCQIGSMVESSIASAAGFHLALSKKNIISTEVSGPVMFTKEPGDLDYSPPHINLSNKPGLGITVDEDVIQELVVK
ncbi:N-succinyl-L-Arg/Lys racemase [Lentibacillus kapialis]|uniref:Dipeptide epimerase n=1 Tax=Lentibacillus kapialis TaxID=340214 RepID=A0A917PYC6_9BACI|nr:dipeptide epimerase [Lentibacillus kapialis]GGJ99147.1 N-succinyl-L-Arg/Lys racemase [Lentibacillus kapialis]